MGIVEKQDLEERRRIVAKMKEGRKQRFSIHESKAKQKYKTVYLKQKVLLSSDSISLGDRIRSSIVNSAKRAAMMDPGTVLVKDGKLTPEGIKRGIKLPDTGK